MFIHRQTKARTRFEHSARTVARQVVRGGRGVPILRLWFWRNPYCYRPCTMLKMSPKGGEYIGLQKYFEARGTNFDIKYGANKAWYVFIAAVRWRPAPT